MIFTVYSAGYGVGGGSDQFVEQALGGDVRYKVTRRACVVENERYGLRSIQFARACHKVVDALLYFQPHGLPFGLRFWAVMPGQRSKYGTYLVVMGKVGRRAAREGFVDELAASDAFACLHVRGKDGHSLSYEGLIALLYRGLHGNDVW